MERETGLEPATSSLGSWHSTTELLPLSRDLNYSKQKSRSKWWSSSTRLHHLRQILARNVCVPPLPIDSTNSFACFHRLKWLRRKCVPSHCFLGLSARACPTPRGRYHPYHIGHTCRLDRHLAIQAGRMPGNAPTGWFSPSGHVTVYAVRRHFHAIWHGSP